MEQIPYRQAHKQRSLCCSFCFTDDEKVPKQPYTDIDLNWRNKQSKLCENIADYDTVWIGFPIWWYTAPTIAKTFIEAHDLSGKVLNVFATSGGSGVEGSVKDLKKVYPQYKLGESRLMN